MKRKTNFDRYLREQLKDKDFADRFKKAGRAWDVALQLTALRKKAGLSQKELAKRIGTSQQQISRLESTSYEGHSLSMLRRVAEILGATVKVEIQYKHGPEPFMVAEKKADFGIKDKNKKFNRKG
ncbi:MAG: helix-turn-helix domain-containing protein [Deltaproteobacteria bacterium]|nr:helix-turn-helix domain-containing protein [Deltaproteobacteria bacterium]